MLTPTILERLTTLLCEVRTAQKINLVQLTTPTLKDVICAKLLLSSTIFDPKWTNHRDTAQNLVEAALNKQYYLKAWVINFVSHDIGYTELKELLWVLKQIDNYP